MFFQLGGKKQDDSSLPPSNLEPRPPKVRAEHESILHLTLRLQGSLGSLT